MGITIRSKPPNRRTGLPFGARRLLSRTPWTSATPTPTGKATDKLAYSMAATSSKLAKSNTRPARNAQRRCRPSACRRLLIRLDGFPLMLPRVNPSKRLVTYCASNKIPIIKLDPPPWSELHREKPRPPAKHADQHEQQRDSASIGRVHW